MEQEKLNQNEFDIEQKSSMRKVTPSSKYLASALFIISSFVGGYVGYTLTPKKIVEVEKKITENETVLATQVNNETSEYMLQRRTTAPEKFTEEHPAKYSIVKLTDGLKTTLVENVEMIIPSDYHGDYSSILGLTQLSNTVVLLEYAPYLEGNTYLFRLDTETLNVTNLGSFRDTTLSDDGKFLAITSDDHTQIKFVDTLNNTGVAVKRSGSSDVVYGACEMGCYIFGRWIDNKYFLFDAVRITSNFPGAGSIQYVESFIFDSQIEEIRTPTTAEQQLFLTVTDASWRVR